MSVNVPLLSIRPAVVDDAAGLASANTDAWREAYAGLISDAFLARWKVSPELWQRRLSDAGPGFTVFVATDERQVVGFTAAGPNEDSGFPPSEGAVGHLYSLYVLADYYGRGLGFRLHEAQLEAMRESGFASATLWVLAGNRRAITFYARQGWVDDATVRHEDLDGEVLTEHRYRRSSLASAVRIATG